VGELAELRRAQAVMLLQWSFKTICHQLRKRQPGILFAPSWGQYLKSRQTQLLLRVFMTDA